MGKTGSSGMAATGLGAHSAVHDHSGRPVSTPPADHDPRPCLTALHATEQKGQTPMPAQESPNSNVRHMPVQIAPETYVIQATYGEGTAPLAVHLNAMVIRGAEPIVVDTGAPVHRESYLEDLFGIVEPGDVRWVFISHEDVDHVGNLGAVMDACPNATMVTTWFMCERLGAGGLAVPPQRWLWFDDGDTFDAGDRRLAVVRPPLYDSPTTRDSSTPPLASTGPRIATPPRSNAAPPTSETSIRPSGAMASRPFRDGTARGSRCSTAAPSPPSAPASNAWALPPSPVPTRPPSTARTSGGPSRC